MSIDQRLVADDVDAALDLPMQLLEVGAVGRGLQADVRHPLHRDVRRGSRRTRSRWSGRAVAELVLPGHPAVELVADEGAVADEVPRLGLHALVVLADGGQAVLDRAVAGHVHERRCRSAASRAGRAWRTRCRRTPPRSRARGRARWRGRSTRGWSARGWSGRRRGRSGRARPRVPASFSRTQLRAAGAQLGGPVPGRRRRAGQVLPAPADRRGDGAHASQHARRSADDDRLEPGCSRTRCWVVEVPAESA